MTSVRAQTLTSETPKDITVFRRVVKNSFTSHRRRVKIQFHNTVVIRTHLWWSCSKKGWATMTLTLCIWGHLLFQIKYSKESTKVHLQWHASFSYTQKLKKTKRTICTTHTHNECEQRASDRCTLKKNNNHKPHTLLPDSQLMTCPRRDLLTMIDLTSWRQPHTLSQTLLATAVGDIRLLSADSSLHISPSAVWPSHPVRKSCRPPPQHPSTTPTAPRKVPYKGVGNIAWVLHHHNKKKGKENSRCKFRNWTASPTSPQFVWTFSRTSLHVEFRNFFPSHLKKKKKRTDIFLGGKKPFMVVNKSEE